MNINWTRLFPTVEGKYLRIEDRYWPVVLTHIRKGRWQDAENPEWLYDGVALAPIETLSAVWLGPIEDCPDELHK